ncbi:hypothetical protein L3Q82_016859 [Scortum barcoo]|uniref:Uncharacterized protein n=1 Tax=Scortum barcoo TaxID=214431 RepID=A0ACB8X7U0_9TELE|nr:hypothetical protein L3Q82_016859 [Scortum barcoo]
MLSVAGVGELFPGILITPRGARWPPMLGAQQEMSSGGEPPTAATESGKLLSPRREGKIEDAQSLSLLCTLKASNSPPTQVLSPLTFTSSLDSVGVYAPDLTDISLTLLSAPVSTAGDTSQIPFTSNVLRRLQRRISQNPKMNGGDDNLVNKSELRSVFILCLIHCAHCPLCVLCKLSCTWSISSAAPPVDPAQWPSFLSDSDRTDQVLREPLPIKDSFLFPKRHDSRSCHHHYKYRHLVNGEKVKRQLAYIF